MLGERGGPACPRCGAAAPSGAGFCQQCGASLAAGCPTCGSPVSPGARFCPQCGSALSGTPPPPTAPAGRERRLVSVLFADLVGYTTFSESRDPEEVRGV